MNYNQEITRNDRVEQLDYQFIQSIVLSFQMKIDEFLPDETNLKELKVLATRRIENNEYILLFNQILLTSIENTLRQLHLEQK